MNLLYHVPQAERAAEEDSRKRLAQEMSRLQSTLEYLLLKGDTTVAQHEIAVLAHNHDVIFAALTDDRQRRSSRRRGARGSAGRSPTCCRSSTSSRRRAAIRERRAGMTTDANGDELLGYAGILLGGERDELRPSRTGSLFLAYDLKRYKAEARAQVLQQSLYWAGWVTALALAMWLVFHFLLTRRTARLVHAAEQLAAGNLAARSDLKGTDELGRLEPRVRRDGAQGRRHADPVAQDIAERKRSAEALRVSEASYRAIFDAAEDAIFVHDIETGAIVDVNPKACATFGYTREEFRTLDVGTLGTGEHPYTQQDAMGLIARAFAGEQLRVEWHGKSKDGTLRWHEVFVKRVTIGGQRPHPGARARHHRPQGGGGGAAGERGAVPRDVQRVDRRARAVERGRRDRRHQSRAVADVRLQRRRVLRAAARQRGPARRITRRSCVRWPPASRCTSK